MRGWIWMKFCVSTDVGIWTNWLTFVPDPDHSAENLKSVWNLKSVRHLTQSRLQVTGCTAERYCLLRVVVQGPESFYSLLNYFVWRTVAELRGVKRDQFSDFGLHSNTPHIRIGVARHCSDAWFWNSFTQSPVETTLSEIHALHRVSF